MVATLKNFLQSSVAVTNLEGIQGLGIGKASTFEVVKAGSIVTG